MTAKGFPGDRSARDLVVVLETIAPEGVRVLGEADLEVVDLSGDGMSSAQCDEILPQATAVVVRSGTTVDRAFLDRTPRLRVIARAGTGLDKIDLAEAQRRGIAVVNAAGSNALAAAEHTFALLLALVRRIVPAHHHLDEGGWERSRFAGTELAGKTLGLVGVGRIGRLVSSRAQAFGMELLASDPLLTEMDAKKLKVEKCELDELLRRADVLSLHLPLNDATRGLIGEAQLARMKPTAVLINAARGGLVDEAALARALRDGRLAGAALDVFETEPPPPDHPLLHRDDVVHTPHVGASTLEAARRVSVDTARALVEALGKTGT